MWKKISSLLFFALLGMLAKSGEIQAQVAQGNIDLQQVSHNPANPTGICQCDTIRVRYEVKPAANFSATSTFEFQFSDDLGSFDPPATVINLDLVDLLVGINPDVHATSVLDTFDTGLKWARLAIPCSAPLFGSSLRIVNRDANGNITAGGVSDTAMYNVNRIPTVAVIDSVSMLTGVGAPQDTFHNPYTTTVAGDIGICHGDSVYLRANNDGTSYQWYNGNTPLAGETNEFVTVHSSGQYYVEVFDGACSIFSDTMTVELMDTPTDITFRPNAAQNSNAYSADRTSPLDSVGLCYGESALLEGPLVPSGTGLTFTYQWLTDSLNPTTGLRDTFEIPGATNANLTLSQNNYNPGWNRYWLVVNDGFCTDTTPQPYHLVVDTLPNADVVSAPFPGFGGVFEFGEVCMKDSLNLTTVPNLPDPMWKYRWQWYDPAGTGTWRSVSGRPSSNLSFDTMPSITIDTSLSDPGQPYFQDPKPVLRSFRVRINTITASGEETCVFFSDSIVVRWKPGDSITYNQSNPNVFEVGRDSINFCASESAVLEGPLAPSGWGLSYTYQWLTDSLNTTTGRRDTFGIAGATNVNLTLNQNNFSPGWNRYWLVMDDGICTDTTRTYYVRIDTVPNAEVVSAPFPGFGGTVEFGEVCMMDSVNLTTVPSIPDPSWKYRWQWYDPSGGGAWRSVSGRPLSNLSFDTLPRITIDTSLSDPGQPYFQDPKPALRLFRVRINSLSLTGEEACVFFSDSIVVRWKPEDSITYNQSNANIFQVGRDSITFCTTDSAELIASETPPTLVGNGYFYNYQWLQDQYDSTLSRYVPEPIPGETLRRLTVRDAGRYYVAIDDGICVDTVRTFTVFVDSLPSTSVVVSSYPGQSVPNDRDLCLTDSIMLAATDTILPGWEYQWQIDAGSGWNNALNDTLPWLSVDTAYRPVGVDTVWFRLAISYENRFGLMTCPDTTAPISVQFYDPPIINLEPSDSVAICEGDSVRIIATGNAQSFVWNGTHLGPTQWFDQPGRYTVTGTGLNGCTTTREVIVSNYQTTANAGPDITTTSGSTVTLSGSGGDNYRWFSEKGKPLGWSGDLFSGSVGVTYTLPEGVSEDSIRVYLEVTNEDGCTDLDSMYLIVQSPEDPGTGLLSRAHNFFSPNNDGVNDLWNISSIVDEYNGCSITVLNRWGATVYEEENFDGVWEGNNQGGNELPDGTYYYVLSCDGQVVLKNAVTIIRNN